MFQTALLLSVLAFVLLILLLHIHIAPSLRRVSIRAPTLEESKLLELYRKRQQRGRQRQLLADLEQSELFIIRMLKSGVYTVQEIIGVIASLNNKLSPYFKRCYNRYFQCGASAIEDMKHEWQDDSFAILCDALVYAASYGRKEMGKRVEEHLAHLNQLRAYRRQRVISHKETRFTFSMVLPLLAFLIVQIYPWLARALQYLKVIGW